VKLVDTLALGANARKGVGVRVPRWPRTLIRKKHMARYDYKCEQCHYIFEVTKPVKDYDRKEFCPQCKAEARRVYLKPNPVKIK
jgi:putative FmdB family regulatory protein